MKKLCFGSYASVLVLCKPKNVAQKLLFGTMFLSVAPNYDIRDDDGTVSSLVLGKKNLSPDVTDNVRRVDARSVAEYFKQNIVTLLDENKKAFIVLALKDIVASDDSIEPDTVVEKVNGLTKASLAKRDSFVLHEFLAGMFLYTAINVENRKCESYVKVITKEYVQSFEAEKDNVTFLTPYSNFSMEIANEIAIDSRALTLVTETGGKCLNCGRPLGIKKEGNDINYAEFVYLSDSDVAPVCIECKRELQSASKEKKLSLLSDKREMEKRITARDALSRYTLEEQIEELLRDVHLMDITDDTKLKYMPIKTEKKITEKRLRERVLSDVTLFYEGVNNTLDRLAGESKLNVDKFAKNVRRMYEDASETLVSESEIYNALVETLFDKHNHKYKEACEIVISYFVQRCEVFDEIAE